MAMELMANEGMRAETNSWLKNGHLADGYGIRHSSACRRNAQYFSTVNRTQILI